mmetsp:Transcript_77445/g.239057  ORF Transcript_77445/g.239057 Transcript_77445/m.239057 type:complete len:248 (+) Transcript_77445:1074-1817(+)
MAALARAIDARRRASSCSSFARESPIAPAPASKHSTASSGSGSCTHVEETQPNMVRPSRAPAAAAPHACAAVCAWATAPLRGPWPLKRASASPSSRLRRSSLKRSKRLCSPCSDLPRPDSAAATAVTPLAALPLQPPATAQAACLRTVSSSSSARSPRPRPLPPPGTNPKTARPRRRRPASSRARSRQKVSTPPGPLPSTLPLVGVCDRARSGSPISCSASGVSRIHIQTGGVKMATQSNPRLNSTP